MRRLGLLLYVLAASMALAGGITLNTATRFEFTDCISTGSGNQTLTEGQYLLRITDSDVFICYASTCTGTSGEKFPQNTVILLNISRGGQVVSCRSAASTGDAIFTNAN